MFLPVRLVAEGDARELRTRAKLFKDFGGRTIDRRVAYERRIVWLGLFRAYHALSASPCHQLSHVVISDFGDKLILAEIVNEPGKVSFCVLGTSMMLANFDPIPVSNVI